MESEADKLFKELGYTKYEHNIFKEPIPKHTWITQDSPYIEYIDTQTIKTTTYSMFIIFMVDVERIQVGASEPGIDTNGNRYKRTRNPILNKREIEAIRLKVQELKWKEV